MEPRIQYAKTEDGVNIAFWTFGKGEPPLVYMEGPPYSHLQLEWQIPAYRTEYELLAEKRKVVRYDGRGSGLSDREVSDYSHDAHLLDLEAGEVDAFAVLREFLEELGPRESATEQELAAAQYLQSRFQEFGYATELQTFTVEDISLAGLGLTINTPQPSEFTALPLIRTGLGQVSGVVTPVGLAMPGDLPDGGLEGRILVEFGHQLGYRCLPLLLGKASVLASVLGISIV